MLWRFNQAWRRATALYSHRQDCQHAMQPYTFASHMAMVQARPLALAGEADDMSTDGEPIAALSESLSGER
jgi:hypothetical protein